MKIGPDNGRNLLACSEELRRLDLFGDGAVLVWGVGKTLRKEGADEQLVDRVC